MFLETISSHNGNRDNRQDKVRKDRVKPQDRHDVNKPSCSVCGKPGHKVEVCWYRSGNSSNNHSSAPKLITCFLCHKEGHHSHEYLEKGKGPGGRDIKKEFGNSNIRKASVVWPS